MTCQPTMAHLLLFETLGCFKTKYIWGTLLAQSPVFCPFDNIVSFIPLHLYRNFFVLKAFICECMGENFKKICFYVCTISKIAFKSAYC